MTKPTYRSAQHQDMAALIPLMSQLGYQHTANTIAANISAVRKAGGEVFIAEHSGEVIGCICAIIDVRLAEGVQGEIVSLVVNENSRGSGIGKGLVKAAEQWLFEHTPTIRVRANQVRKEAHLFYQSLGYEESKRQAILTKAI